MAKSHITGTYQYTMPRLEVQAALDTIKHAPFYRENWNFQTYLVSFVPIAPSFCKACGQTSRNFIFTLSVTTYLKTHESARLKFRRH